MKLTIITTAFNAEQYIETSLNSLLDQSYQDFELIMVDDGSSDQTQSIMLKYKDKFKKCRFLVNKFNEGIPVSRNRALLIAEGEYIAIHDADDVSFKDRFLKEIQHLDKNNSTVVVGSYAMKINHSGELIGSMVYPPLDTVGAFSVITRYKLNPIIDPTCMFRKDIIMKHGAYSMVPEIVTALDFELWCRLLCHGYLVSNIAEPLISYRINPNGVTRTRNKEMVEATDMIWSRFRRKNFEDPKLRAEMFQQDCYTEIP